MRSKTKKPVRREEPTSEIVTFRDPRGYGITNLINREPSCMNGHANYRQWRVTVTPVEEPQEILAERVRQLWRECHNHHNWAALEAAARQVGIELDRDERGTEPEKS